MCRLIERNCSQDRDQDQDQRELLELWEVDSKCDTVLTKFSHSHQLTTWLTAISQQSQELIYR